MYEGIADEISLEPHFIELEADPYVVTVARSYAKALGLPWPPPADVDIAIQLVDEALRRNQQ